MCRGSWSGLSELPKTLFSKKHFEFSSVNEHQEQVVKAEDHAVADSVTLASDKKV